MPMPARHREKPGVRMRRSTPSDDYVLVDKVPISHIMSTKRLRSRSDTAPR